MKLPEFDRVIYEYNPLFEVVCQLTFPPILKISHQEPVEFQDEIRFQYPLVERTQPQIPPEIARLFNNLICRYLTIVPIFLNQKIKNGS